MVRGRSEFERKNQQRCFSTENGSHVNRQLQKDWNDLEEEAFQIVVLEQLEYEEDESKTDYREELELLKIICTDKLKEQELSFISSGGYHSCWRN